jgi:unconventional prefoldin RPB5 interactor 1
MGAVSSDPKPSRKKSVAFVEDRREEGRRQFPDHKGLKDTSEQPAVQNHGADIGKITEVTEDEEEHPCPVVPVDESPEDAALRREMLKYTFSEVGAVVAELDLEEHHSQDSYSDDYDEEDQETSSVEEEEDKFGRTTRRVVDDKYRNEMEELERKLNARMMENVGPRPNQPSVSDTTEDLRQLSVAHNVLAKTASEEPKPVKKGVRFAEELDISPAPQKVAVSTVPKTGSLRPPLEESIFERESMTGGPPKPEPPKPRKVSRFKSSHVPSALTAKQSSNSPNLQGSVNDGGSLANVPLSEGVIERRVPSSDPSPPLAPAATAKTSHRFSPARFSPATVREEPRVAKEGPPGETLSDSVIERFTAGCSTEPPDPDGLAPALLRQEVAMKYHRMRNRMIQREGGFMPREEELERVPLTEEEGGSGKKVSRFKAARLR